MQKNLKGLVGILFFGLSIIGCSSISYDIEEGLELSDSNVMNTKEDTIAQDVCQRQVECLPKKDHGQELESPEKCTDDLKSYLELLNSEDKSNAVIELNTCLSSNEACTGFSECIGDVNLFEYPL